MDISGIYCRSSRFGLDPKFGPQALSGDVEEELLHVGGAFGLYLVSPKF